MLNTRLLCLLAAFIFIEMPAKASSEEEIQISQRHSEGLSKALSKNKPKKSTSHVMDISQSRVLKLGIPVIDAETPRSRVLKRGKDPNGFNTNFTKQGTQLLTPCHIPSGTTQQAASKSSDFDTEINIKISIDGLPELTTEQSNLGEEEEEKRTHVNKTKEIPYRMHGHMMMEFSNGSICTGSGTLIGPYHVLTAGHNIFSHDRGGWAVEVNFIPGLNGNEIPYTRAKAVRLLSLEGWVKNKDSNHDMAMVILDRAVGKETGWFGLFSGTNKDLMSLPSIHVTGYPGEKGKAGRMSTQMWTMEGSVEPPIESEKLYYKIITTAGQSGGSIWTTLKEENYYTLGVHTDGVNSKSKVKANSGIRLTSSKFRRLLKWLNGEYLADFTEPIRVNKWPSEETITQEDLEALASDKIKGLDFTNHYFNPQELELLLQDENLCFLRVEGCAAFSITPDVQFLPNLKVLELPDSKLEDSHLCSLLSNNKLLKLDLSGNPEVKSPHMTYFRQHETLTDLDLSRTGVDDNGLESLARNTRLRKLNLSETRITDKGVEYLIKAIEEDKSAILFLNLTKNTFSDSTKNKLKKLKKRNPDLKIEFEDDVKESNKMRASPGFKGTVICCAFIILLLSCFFTPWVAVLYTFLFPNNPTMKPYENGNSLSVYEASFNDPIITPNPSYSMCPYGIPLPVSNGDFRQNSTSETSIILRNPNFRSWENVTSTTPVYYLEARLKNFIESIPEDSEESHLTRLWKMFHEISNITDPSLSRQVTIWGMGGLGKSSLALAYAYEALKHKAYNIIYWIRSETDTTLIDSYKNLLKAINISFENDAPNENIINLIKQHIPDKGKSLLVYDNVPEPGFLTEKIPESVNILITSRCGYGWPTPHNIELIVFRPEEAVKYLFDQTNINKTEENTRQALDLAEALGRLPLALSHAAAYISYVNTDNSYGFNDYLQAFKQEPGTHFSTHVNPFSLEKNQSISHEHLISKTWSLAGQIISPFAKELMVYFAYLEPEQIMRDYFLRCSDNKKDLREAFSQLVHFSLIKGSQHFYSIHRLVQLVIRHQQETLHLESLKGSLEDVLSSFENYRQTVEQELKEEASLAKLNNLDTRIRAMHINAVSLSNHLQRIARVQENNDFFPLKFNALGLQYLVNNSTSIKIKNQIYKLLGGTELDEKEAREQETAIRNELTRKDIFLLDETIKRLAKDLSLIVPFDLSSPYLNYLIDTIEQISPLERTKFVGTIVSLLNDTRNTIEILYPLPYDQVKIIIDFLDTLPAVDMQGRERAIIIDAFMAVAPEDRADIIKYLPSLWDERMMAYDKANIIKSIGKVAANEREEFITYMHDLYPKNIDAHDFHNVIDDLVLVPADQRLEMTKIVMPLLHQKMRGRDIASIIRSLAKIAVDQRSGIIKDLLPLWNDSIEGAELAALIDSLAQFAIKDRLELVNLIARLLNDDPALKNKINGFIIAGTIRAIKQSPEHRSRIINDHIISYTHTQQGPQPLSTMSGEERCVFMEHLFPLCPKDISFDAKIKLAKIFIKVDPDEREDVAKYLPFLWNVCINIDEIGIGEILYLIEVLAGLDRKEREAIFFLWNGKMTPHERSQVLNAYFTIKPRADIVKYLPFLWNELMDGYRRSIILEAVSTIDPSEREDVLKYAPSLWNDHMDGHERSTVIKFLSGIEHTQRRTLAQLFQVHVKDVNKNDWLKILAKLREIPQEKRIQVSEKFIFLWNAAKANNTVQNLSDLSKNITRNILKDGGVANLFQIVEQAGY